MGRLRPDWFSRCILPANTPIDTPYYNAAECTAATSEAQLKDGQMSYPSGHTSFAFCQGTELCRSIGAYLWALVSGIV